MKDSDCIQFLQWALPKLRMQWQGFRKVRGQVCKRIDARLKELGFPDIGIYKPYLEDHPEEWNKVDSFCRITISHFYRDREVFSFLGSEVFPRLTESIREQGFEEMTCWSIGCASGEEPYSLALLWDFSIRLRFFLMKIRILATDAEKTMIDRANRGCYPPSSVRELPPEWMRAFARDGNLYCIRTEEREKIAFRVHDIRTEAPDEKFHLILCRNLVFTYFEETLQQEILSRLSEKLLPGGALVIGIHESLPSSSAFQLWHGSRGIYRKV